MPRTYWNLEIQPKGVPNRNQAIRWLLEHVEETGDASGVVYFADDDNTYDLQLFEEVKIQI